MYEYRKRLAKKLKEHCGDMSERQFAKKLGIGQSTLNRFTNCTQAASLDTIEKICKRLKIDITEFFIK